jgi:aspartate oxidase
VATVGHLLDEHAGVLRTGAGLEAGLAKLRTGGASESAADAVEMASMICAAALARPHSVGAHQRMDKPETIAV